MENKQRKPEGFVRGSKTSTKKVQRVQNSSCGQSKFSRWTGNHVHLGPGQHMEQFKFKIPKGDINFCTELVLCIFDVLFDRSSDENWLLCQEFNSAADALANKGVGCPGMV